MRLIWGGDESLVAGYFWRACILEMMLPFEIENASETFRMVNFIKWNFQKCSKSHKNSVMKFDWLFIKFFLQFSRFNGSFCHQLQVFPGVIRSLKLGEKVLNSVKHGVKPPLTRPLKSHEVLICWKCLSPVCGTTFTLLSVRTVSNAMIFVP